MPSSQCRLPAGGLLLWTALYIIHLPSSSSLAQSGSIVSYPLIPHHQERARRSLQGRSMPRRTLRKEKHLRRRTVGQEVGPLFQGYGTHYVDLWVGTPPQRQTVIVDTGSGTTAFPCSDCNKCGAGEYHIDDVFDERLSTTYRPTTCSKNKDCVSYHSTCKTGECHITQAYSEGSRWDAVEAIDACYIAGPHEQPLIKDYHNPDPWNPKRASHYAFNLTFGCQFEVTGMFEEQLADGILGMNNGGTPYWQQMSDSAKLGNEMFALCYSRQPTADKAGTEAGTLTLGGCDTQLHETDMVYTSGATDGKEKQWSVSIRKIFLRDGSAGESVNTSNKKATRVEVKLDNQLQGIVDSGTTDTFLPSILAESFKGAYKQVTGDEYSADNPMKLTEAELAKMPTVILQMVSSSGENGSMDYQTPGLAGKTDEANPYDVLLAIPPSHYMEYDEEDQTYTARLHLDKSGESFTLGANAMMGHDVLFDAENDRIGWAESSCDYTQLAEDNGYAFRITGVIQEPADEDEDEDADADVDVDADAIADVVGDAHEDSDYDANIDGDAETNIDADADADIIVDTDADADTDIDIDIETDADTNIDVDAGAGADTDTDTDTNIDADADADIDIDTGADTNIDVDADTNVDAGAGADTDTDTNIDADADTDIDTDASVDGDKDSDADADSDCDAFADSDVEVGGGNATVGLNSTIVTEVGGNGTNSTDVAPNVEVGGGNATVGLNSTSVTEVDGNGTNSTDVAPNVEVGGGNAIVGLNSTSVTEVDGIGTNSTSFGLNGTSSTDVAPNDANATTIDSHVNTTDAVLGTNTTSADEDTEVGEDDHTEVDEDEDTEVDEDEDTEVDEDEDTEVGEDEDTEVDEDEDEDEDTESDEDEDAEVDEDEDEDPSQNATSIETPGIDNGNGSGAPSNVTEPGKANIDSDTELEKEYDILGKEPKANVTEPGKLNIDPDSDLESEYDILKEEENLKPKEKDAFEAVDCHEERIDRTSNITMVRVKNETVVAFCKVKNSAGLFMSLCDSKECQIPVLVGLVVALCAGMCLCSCLRCFFYYLCCCCCCKKKDKGPRYEGLNTDEFEEMPSYSDDPDERDEPRRKKKYRDNVRSKKKRTSLSHKNGGEFI